jgi:hypothetical protein
MWRLSEFGSIVSLLAVSLFEPGLPEGIRADGQTTLRRPSHELSSRTLSANSGQNTGK